MTRMFSEREEMRMLISDFAGRAYYNKKRAKGYASQMILADNPVDASYWKVQYRIALATADALKSVVKDIVEVYRHLYIA